MQIERYKCPWLANDFHSRAGSREDRDIEVLCVVDLNLKPCKIICPGYRTDDGGCNYRTSREGASGDDAGTLEYKACILNEGWQELKE